MSSDYFIYLFSHYYSVIVDMLICSVSEFTSSTGSIRVSVCEFTGFCEKIWCVDTCFP